MTEDTEVCANIGPKQRQRRLNLGIFGAAGAVASAFALGDTSAAVRSFVFLPLLVAAFGFYQYYTRTCVRLAATGRRNLDTGSEKITDTAELSAIRRQAMRVQLMSIATAAAITAIYLMAT